MCLKVHLPSKTVFSNWPGPKTLKGHVTATDFSPSSSFFAVGNDKGKALLFRYVRTYIRTYIHTFSMSILMYISISIQVELLLMKFSTILKLST